MGQVAGAAVKPTQDKYLFVINQCNLKDILKDICADLIALCFSTKHNGNKLQIPTPGNKNVAWQNNLQIFLILSAL